MLLSPDFSTILEEQKAYYEARSSEYDEWWERRGRYDLGAEGNARWREEIRMVEAIFDQVPIVGHILEPAGGTGNWTLYLARRAERVTVLDCSASMLALNRARMEKAGLSDRVEYETEDLFSWTPPALYDSVFLGFVYSHVPSMLADSFLRLMASALKPGGCLCMLEAPEGFKGDSNAQRTYRIDGETELRTLKDGRAFRIVKRYDHPEDLHDALQRAGLESKVALSGEQFMYAVAYSRLPQ